MEGSRESVQSDQQRELEAALRDANTAATAELKRDRTVVGWLRAASQYDSLCAANSPVRDAALAERARRLWNAREEAVKVKWPEDVTAALLTKCRDDLVAATELSDDASNLLVTVHNQLGDVQAAEAIRHARRARIAETLPYLTPEQKKALVESRTGRVSLTGLY